MNSKNSFVWTAAVALALAGLGMAGSARFAAAPAHAAKGQPNHPGEQELPPHEPGQVIARLAPGVSAESVAEAYGIRVERQARFAPNVVLFSGVEGDLHQAVEQLEATEGVQAAQLNFRLSYTALPFVEPNDPFSGEQWALRQLHGPSSWGIAVGERLVNGPVEEALISIIDGNITPSHPDLAANFVDGSYDFILDQPLDESDLPFLRFISHGTNVAGCAAAVSNNSVGISSLPWEGVKLLGCHIGSLGPDVFAAIDAVYYSIQQGADVINMSFGGPPGIGVLFPVFSQSIKDAYDAGIVVCASTGNSAFGGRSRGVSYPAELPWCIPIGASGPSGARSYYSDFGDELRDRGVLAPGGDAAVFDTRSLILTTSASRDFFAPEGYTYTQGTSFSSPYAAGVVAFLLTQGARDATLTGAEHVEAIRDLLRRTARGPLGGPNEEVGAGLIDVERALKYFSPYVELTAPLIGETTASLTEAIQTRLVLPGGADVDDSLFDLQINGRDVTDVVDLEDDGFITYQPEAEDAYPVGRNLIELAFEDPERPELRRTFSTARTGYVPDQAYVFRVQPHQETPGVKMFSLPYELQDQAEDPDFLFDEQLRRLARWIPGENRYAIWDPLGSPQDSAAELLTDAAGVPAPPIGIGFWARIDRPVELKLFGKRSRETFYPIPLAPGFNLIGNPFPYRVPWGFVSVQVGREILSITQAADRGLIRSAIWRYRDGRYVVRTLPEGELAPWEGHWVRNTSGREMTLLVPNAGAPPASRAGGSAPSQVSAADGPSKGDWTATLSARSSQNKGLFGSVRLGQRAGARSTWDPADLDAPPTIPGSRRFNIANHNWGANSGLYEQDIRSPASRREEWRIEVEAGAGERVTLNWNGINVRRGAWLRLPGKNKPVRAQTAGTTSFVAPAAGIHTVKISIGRA